MEFKINKSFNELLEDELSAILKDAITIRRHLHMHPEIGFDTHKTEAFVTNHLKEAGITILPAKIGVIGLIRGNDEERFVALRADMDALCLQEENDKPYKSKEPNKMHACGHDGHTAMLISAAMILQKNRDKLPLSVLLLFQPAEEGPNLGGARIMLDDLKAKGLADKIVGIFGQHLFNDYPTGLVGLKQGPLASSTDEFDIKIIGKGGHAGQPHKTVDAISVGSKFVAAMESFMSRRIDPFDPAIFSIGIFHSGTAKNIVAGTARIAGTIRCQNNDTRKYIIDNMKRIANDICKAYEASCSIDILHGLPVLENCKECTTYGKNVAVELFGKDKVFEIEHPMMGAEDFAYFAEEIPASFIWIGSGNAEKGFIYLAHHPKFDFDEDAMKTGIKMLCGIAANISV